MHGPSLDQPFAETREVFTSVSSNSRKQQPTIDAQSKWKRSSEKRSLLQPSKCQAISGRRVSVLKCRHLLEINSFCRTNLACGVVCSIPNVGTGGDFWA